jgi:alkanesulfonate monooxygenase SsuD/methylene tetrahydromethanopterin reductase-like flavin-dependent oxidoreductase (luciferase family)
MLFDLFHSVSDPEVNGRCLGHKKAVENFFDQARLAESLGMDTLWLAESHFSSETQKQTSVGTVPNFRGEIGLNCDSFQYLQYLAAITKKLNLGTGIHNIVGGSGGPIASADRVNALNFFSRYFWHGERSLRIGIASGRFPYQNTAFGLVPRSEMEMDLWANVRTLAFLEALEIFFRLLRGEELSSSDVSTYSVFADEVENPKVRAKYKFPVTVNNRWQFETLKLVPERAPYDRLRIVLGSSHHRALEVASRYWDVDLFNLSFTPPDQIEKMHDRMSLLTSKFGGTWHRSRLPRTVMVFIDRDRKKARELANQVLDTYIEAMRGTAAVPAKETLLERALIGDAEEVREQLHPGHPKRFHPDDRLMLWFEFNQQDNDAIRSQMIYFSEQVAARP